MLRNLNIYNKYKLQVCGNTHIYSVVILSYSVSLHTFGITSGAFLALLLNLLLCPSAQQLNEDLSLHVTHGFAFWTSCSPPLMDLQNGPYIQHVAFIPENKLLKCS